MADGEPDGGPTDGGSLLQMLPESWRGPVSREVDAVGGRDRIQELDAFLNTRQMTCPPKELWFRCLEGLEPEDVKVIILGRDPHPEPGDANGLAYGVSDDCPQPTALKNVIKAAQRSLDEERGRREDWNIPGSLDHWRSQGVLLVNLRLTTAPGRGSGHAGKGWEVLTSAIVAVAAKASPHCTAMLWGAEAQTYRAHLRESGAEILMAGSPDPGLLGARGDFHRTLCFYHANVRRKMKRLPLIKWDQ